MSDGWIKILSEIEDDSIDWQILDWAEVRDLWDEHYDLLYRYSVVGDLLPDCDSAEIISEEYDCDFPGRSGVLYTIETNDPEQLKLEIRDRIEQLINPPPQSIFTTIDPTQVREIEQIVDFLMAEAATVRNLRAPAGYQVLAVGTANALEAAAQDLLTGSWDKARLSSHLSALLDKIASSGTQSALKTILKNLQ